MELYSTYIFSNFFAHNSLEIYPSCACINSLFLVMSKKYSKQFV